MEDVVGYASLRRRNGWFDNECQEAHDKKNEVCRQYVELNTDLKRENYENLQRKNGQCMGAKVKQRDMEEIESAIRWQKMNKTPGIHGISA